MNTRLLESLSVIQIRFIAKAFNAKVWLLVISLQLVETIKFLGRLHELLQR